MQEIKDEDRIIGKICRGELSITNRDIKNLATADLGKRQEERFEQLADEIKATLERNRKIRKEIQEKLQLAEQNEKIKQQLEETDREIRELKYEYSKKRYTSAWKMMIGAIIPFCLGLVPALIISLFTSSLWALGSAVFIGFFTGVGIDVKLAVNSQNKSEKLENEIKKLEQDRLALIEASEYDASKKQENEVKSNIVNRIYKESFIITSPEDDCNINL
ncbi:MAG: hypothetical protein IJW36_00870 [Clostridia bacterium]|nr:hypothetical protein [Clostridia bacterium]